MRIVITGARGFIGSNLSKHLAAKGHEVIGLGRSANKKGYVRLDAETGQTASESFQMADHLHGAEAVIHLAAKKVDNLEAPLSDYIPYNLELTEEICRFADRQTLKKMLFASSRLVYPGHLSHHAKETFQGCPDNTYGLSKKFSEEIIFFYAEKYKFTGISLRLGQVFGSDPRNMGAIARFIQQAKEQKQVTVLGQGEAVRDFVYIKDIVSAFDHALESEAPSGAYNIGSGCGYSIRDLALAVSEVFLDGERSVLYKNVVNEDRSRYVMDCGKARDYLGWESAWGIKNALLD